MSLILFWTSLAVIVYTYLLFPLILLVRGSTRRQPHGRGDFTPTVSMLIAAHNEAGVISRKLENILSLNYPSEKLEIIVASDGSEDGTNEIVARYADRGVRLLIRPRQGKAAALNAAAALATGEILVFSDANSIYAPDALRNLVQPFADAEVGGVAGNQRYLSTGEAASAKEGEKSYWQLDRWMKRLESEAGDVISATGAIYAIRRRLFQPIVEGVTDDFYTSTAVIAQGSRLLFAPDAVAYEPVAGSSREEFGRKVRVISRGLRGVWLRRALLNPFRYGFYAIQLLSHKVLRRLVALPLLVLLLVSPGLWSRGRLYQLATVGQLGFYGLAAIGALLDGKELGQRKLFALPYYFVMVNVAVLAAVWNILRGRRIVTWEPQRRTNENAAISLGQRSHLEPLGATHE